MCRCLKKGRFEIVYLTLIYNEVTNYLHLNFNSINKLLLKKNKEAPLKRFHHWIFSGALQHQNEKPADGSIVEVYSYKKEYLGIGHYNDGNICVRMLSFQKENINTTFWLSRIQQAKALRTAMGLTENPATNAYRLIHGEGDRLPGLVIDNYNGHFVLQAHSTGMHHSRHQIAEALQTCFGDELKSIYYKSGNTLPKSLISDEVETFLVGDATDTIILENELQFYVNWKEGQKTGFFLDQRLNRQLLGSMAKGKRILNAFCYSGGFSMYALKEGAALVHSVDASQKAIDWTLKNEELNSGNGTHKAEVADVSTFIKNSPMDYDIVILDPPAFAKNIRSKHRATIGYKKLNKQALKKMQPGSILFTFSCSQPIDLGLFENTVRAAAIEAGRKIQVIKRLGQPTDHPVNLFHPEVSYLKGLVLYIS